MAEMRDGIKELRTCPCGGNWKTHCMNKGCRWLSCAKVGCGTVYDYRTGRVAPRLR